MAPIKQTHFCFDYAHLRFEGEIIIIIIMCSVHDELPLLWIGYEGQKEKHLYMEC